jgi:hypothetical protein
MNPPTRQIASARQRDGSGSGTPVRYPRPVGSITGILVS